ncbi:MAG: hypothetical protein II180_14895 [Proteobacteria bacterium]|nr:hypothetical protein [Pseudomonadota bacterium]
MNSNILLADKCMRILCEHVGIIEAEQFIHFIKTECFDYTEWQQTHYDSIPESELQEAIDKHSKDHPFKGKKAVIL